MRWKVSFSPLTLILLCLCSWTSQAILQRFLKASENRWTTIAIEAKPYTSSGLPASPQYSLADAVDIILNDSPPESQFTADSDSGEEINTQIESSSDTIDSSPTGSLSASCTGARQFSAALCLSWPSFSRWRIPVGAVAYWTNNPNELLPERNKCSKLCVCVIMTLSTCLSLVPSGVVGGLYPVQAFTFSRISTHGTSL